jgi:glycerol-3-phosphate acyltransferase PlsY
MNIVFCIVISYILGSIPTAFILSKVLYQKDIREEGSKNVGTLNFLRISRSKSMSIFVLFIDVLKGYLAIFVSTILLEPTLLILPSLIVIIGHIFPIWIKFKGGRGLATLAGVMLYFQPLLVLFWWLFLGIIYFVIKKYITAGMLALFFVNILTVIFFDIEIFYILSSGSLLVMTQYLNRIKEELLL